MKKTAVIMAGGSGERFWPLSRKEKPKQILNLTREDKNMLQEAIDRVEHVIAADDIYIITNEILLKPIRESLPGLPPGNVIAEPAKRNTAPCLGLAAAFIQKKYGGMGIRPNEIVMAVLTADHKISPDEKFAQTVDAALRHAYDNPVLVTIGVKPTRPSTGYGYIETDDPFIENDKIEIKAVKAFREKPALEKAKEYMNSGRHYWNSGMFFWRLDVFASGMKACLPEVGDKIDDMADTYDGIQNNALDGSNPAVKDIFEAFPNESIDYGLMEKAPNVAVAKALFDWDDLGSYDALERISEPDENSNIKIGNTETLDSDGNIIYNAAANKMLVAALGVRDMIITVTDDAVLVCPKDKAQDIKKMVEKLKDNKQDWI